MVLLQNIYIHIHHYRYPRRALGANLRQKQLLAPLAHYNQYEIFHEKRKKKKLEPFCSTKKTKQNETKRKIKQSKKKIYACARVCGFTYNLRC